MISSGTERVLVIDDEESLRQMLSLLLGREGYLVDSARNGEEGLLLAQQRSYEYILCDIMMPVMDGIGFLKGVHDSGLTATVIMMSAYGTVESAIHCMKEGAYDYISKPFNPDEILLTLKKAEERERLKEENRRLKEELLNSYCFQNIISRNPRMKDIFNQIRKVCDYKTTVLICGESGTGKELIAKAIHYNSIRCQGPFITINCGAIPENLLESELFGHLKGAFTDATMDKAGLFELANSGTIFLDELGEMPFSLQVKLLRVLQEGEIRRVGATKPTKIDVRVISATSRSLSREVADGRFRGDLFYRLNVFSIELPPLRERMEDVPLLVGHFLTKHAARMGIPPPQLTSEAMRCLMTYSWPGNIRELENCIQRGLVLAEGDITRESLPDVIVTAGDTPGVNELPGGCLSLKVAVEAMERRSIAKALARAHGNRTQAARILEISHRSLLYKLKEYSID
jgi:two-component system, NtrC family, response regulator AtoC